MIYIVYGPTASGKTKLATDLAEKFNGELISADSRQIYRYMSIGTGQTDNPPGIHLTNFLNPDEVYSVSKWQKSAYYLISRILQAGKTPIVVGGTGLYIDSLIFPREYGNDVQPFLPLEYSMITPNIDRTEVYEKINSRVDQMFEMGFVEEVKDLIARGYRNTRAIHGAGYEQILEYLENDGKSIQDFPSFLSSPLPARPPILSLDQCIEKVKISYRNYAKRQYTWFKKYQNLN